MKSLIRQGTSLDLGNHVLQGCVIHEIFELEAEQLWDSHEYASLEVKEFGE